MKKIIFYIALIFVTSCSVSTCFAQTIVYNFDNIGVADTITHEIEFATSGNPQVYYPQSLTVVTIECDSANTGTIQFATALTGTPNTRLGWGNKKTYGPGARKIVTIRNGLYNLFYKKTQTSDKFNITN